MQAHIWRAATAVALSTAVAAASPAYGAECIGVQFPDSMKAGDADLALNGIGLRKATFLKVKVYAAGLYLPQKSGDPAKILATDQPWHLVLRFVHDADASDIREAFDDGFKKAAGDKFAALKPRVDALNAQMKDFKTGHYLAYTYQPKAGTVVDVNGARGAAIDGADFASSLLAVSIGPKPPNPELKSGLLGGKCE